jgi:hypothetical protein
MLHMLAYKIMQHWVFIVVRDLNRNIFVKLVKRFQLIPIGHYQQEVLMRKATFLKLYNMCIYQHLTKVLPLNQAVMKIMELGSINPCNQLWTVLRCLPWKELSADLFPIWVARHREKRVRLPKLLH